MSSSPREQQWQEGAGALLLLAAAHETDLLSQLEVALPMKQQHATVQEPAPPQLFQPQLRLLLTLLFLNAVGLHRPWDLRPIWPAHEKYNVKEHPTRIEAAWDKPGDADQRGIIAEDKP